MTLQDMKRTIKTLILTGTVFAASVFAQAAPRAVTVRAVNADEPADSKIIYPESFETDVHKMMQNWYLQNYAVLDKEADSREGVEYTEQEYIDRLGKMNTVIDMPYNKIVRSMINMYVDRKKSLVETMLGMSLYYMPIFERALDKYGLPMELKYLPVIESALNPNAVSRAGATGLWQFMPETASGLGLEINSVVDQRRDPHVSSDAAARYLKQLYTTYGDWSLAIAAYNCGPGNVNKALRRAGGGKKDFWEIYQYLPAETRSYVPAFIAANYAMNYYNKHNISPALARRPIITDTIHVNRRVHFDQISEVLDIPVEEIRALNPQYRTDLIPGDVRPYSLELPNMQVYNYISNEDSIVNHNAEKYARRSVVEPATGSKGRDAKGEYVEELVVKYHKVARGETLASIARKYGVTATSIRKANGIGRRVKRGQTLRINTYKRKYITEELPEIKNEAPVQETPAVLTDSIAAPADSVAAVMERPEPEPVEEEPAAPVRKAEPKKEQPATQTTHTVRSGENLGKIASRYGITVSQLKSANGLSSDRINIGQKLKIPAKKATSKRRRRR